MPSTSRRIESIPYLMRAWFAIFVGCLIVTTAPAEVSKEDLKKIKGRIQFVESFPDYTVQVVESFPDLKVKLVTSFPDDVGKWQIVNSFPDFKIKIVTSCPDFKIKFVDSFPGLP